MTAAELIEQLSKLPPETKCYVRGYEGGHCDCTHLTMGVVERDVHAASDYYGDHEWWRPQAAMREAADRAEYGGEPMAPVEPGLFLSSSEPWKPQDE